MTNTYVQNFISLRQQQGSSSVAQSPVVNEQKRKAAAKTHVKPEKPKGYVVRENPIEAVGSSAVGQAKTYGYFIDAVNGKGTDYSVGRINDGAKFLGSLGIAAALASTAKSPKAKVMEFVGFSTWFGTMALWPLVPGTAIKLVKGVDINQEYVDSYGRRKKFYEDAQYIPWNLRSNKEVYRMGDKLGVPRNIENRREAIQEKATQVAIQGNTLMMLSAGFATPVVTALVCNALEKPVSKAIELVQVAKAEQGLKKLGDNELIQPGKKDLAKLTDIIGTEKTTVLDDEKIKQVKTLFNDHLTGTGINEEMNKHVEALLDTSKSAIKVDESVAKSLHGSLALSDDKIKEILGEKKAGHFDVVKSAINSIDEQQFGKMLENAGDLNWNGKAVLSDEISMYLGEKLGNVKGIKEETLANLDSAIMGQLDGEMAKHNKFEFNTEKIKGLYNIGHDYAARKDAVGNYMRATIGNVADSQTANHWDEAPRKILKALGIDEKTRKLIVDYPLSAPNHIQNHLENLAKDNAKFNEAARKIAEIAENIVTREEAAAYGKDGKGGLMKAWSDIEKATSKNIRTLYKSSFEEEKTKIADIINGIQVKKDPKDGNAVAARTQAAKEIREIRRNNPARPLIYAIKDAVGIEKRAVENKIINTKSSFYRPLLVMERIKDNAPKDVVKELITGFGIDFWSNKGEHRGIKNTKQFGKFVNKAFAPIKNVLKGKEGIGKKINEFYDGNKLTLFQIDGANRKFYHPIIKKYKEINDILNEVKKGEKQLDAKKLARLKKQKAKLDRMDKVGKAFSNNVFVKNDYAGTYTTKNRNSWAERVGKTLEGFVRDAARQQGGKNIWLRRVLYIAAPLTAVSLFSVALFGQKNKYNPDVYQVKKK